MDRGSSWIDIAALELYLPLLVGAKTVIASRDTAGDGVALQELMARSRATVMQATPASWRMLIDGGWQGNTALSLLSGGEALPLSLATQLRERCQVLWNVYGPTETTVWSTISRVPVGPTTVDVGRPIHNTKVMVVDEYLAPVPVGVEGEIVIGGDGVAFGYHKNVESTAKMFCADPTDENQRLYRTGDLGRWLPDGSLQHLGRLDTQLKIRGYQRQRLPASA